MERSALGLVGQDKFLALGSVVLGHTFTVESVSLRQPFSFTTVDPTYDTLFASIPPSQTTFLSTERALQYVLLLQRPLAYLFLPALIPAKNTTDFTLSPSAFMARWPLLSLHFFRKRGRQYLVFLRCLYSDFFELLFVLCFDGFQARLVFTAQTF